MTSEPAAQAAAGPCRDSAWPPWTDLYAERAAEDVLDVNADGAIRISSRTSSGAAFHAVGPGHSCFVQSSLPWGRTVPGPLEDASTLVPWATASWVAAELARVSELVREPADRDEGWFTVARGLVQAARAAALESGATRAQARVSRRHRCYAVSYGDGHARQVSSTVRLMVTARRHAGRGTATAADVPAAPLTIARTVEAGQRAAVLAASQAVATVPTSGDTPVVFAPEPAGLLIHEVIGHALEADVALHSPLWMTRGSLASNPALTVIDDPADPWAWEQVNVDEEGTVCRQADLVVAGQVAGLMADRATASQVGVAVTGHARRGTHTRPPIPRMRHTAVSAGPDSPAGIVADTQRGILVRAVDTADAIPGQGRFSLRIHDACEIVNGETGRPLTGFTVTGELEGFRILDAVGDDLAASVSMCGRQGRWLPVSHSAPTLRFPRLAVRGGPGGS